MTARPPGGVGLDLLEIDRLEAALARRPSLAQRLFTDGERAYAAARSRPGQHLAARFCAKEAVAKALALEAWSWRDIEVVSEGGAPRIVLHGALAGGGHEVDVSLTHSRGTAGAVAVVRTHGSDARPCPPTTPESARP
jgi:holo-[acyl-carrier protein] synthase